ncbi:MAG: hypothetical protein JW828_07740, partial [Sedimentisphaerales bacterium]|nr:hypothetical protein [Sedimentisphaerales bacterium]
MLGFDEDSGGKSSFKQFLARLTALTLVTMAMYYFGMAKFDKVVEQVNATQKEQIAMCEAMYEAADPWQASEDREEEPEIGRVTGVLYSAQNPSVVIDGEILGIGGQIHGVTVTAIGRDSVELEKQGVRWTQKVQEDPPDHWKQKKA